MSKMRTAKSGARRGAVAAGRRHDARQRASARRDAYPIVMSILALLVLCVGLSTISMWQDATQRTATITGAVKHRYYNTLSCARGCARAYYITVGDSVATRDFDVGQTVWGATQDGDQVKITFAQSNGDVYRVDDLRNGTWVNLEALPEPTPWGALLLTLGALLAAALLGASHLLHARGMWPFRPMRRGTLPAR